MDIEDGLADCLEVLGEEEIWGFFPKKIVEWIKGNAVDVSKFVTCLGRMGAETLIAI